MIIIVIFSWRGHCRLDSVVCCACSIEAMSHCPYLLHKFVINYLFDLCALFIQVTNCSIRVSQSFTGSNNKAVLLYCIYFNHFDNHNHKGVATWRAGGLQPVNPCILHWNNCTVCPTNVFIVWKEDASLPALFNPLCSSMNQQLFKKNFYNQSSHYENYRRFNGSHHMPTTKSTLFVVNKDEWYTKEGHGKSMKNALYVQQYSKRHPLGWSDVEQQKKSSL